MFGLKKILTNIGYTHHEQECIIKVLYLADNFNYIRLAISLAQAGYRQDECEVIIQHLAQNMDLQNKDLSSCSIDKLSLFSVPEIPDQQEFALSRLTKTLHWFKEIVNKTLSESNWAHQYSNEIAAILKSLAPPQQAPLQSIYQSILITGGNAEEMAEQLNYVKQLLNDKKISADHIYLLPRKRVLSNDTDSTEWVQQIASVTEEDPETLTESIAMNALFSAMSLDLKRQLPHTLQPAGKNLSLIDTIDKFLTFQMRDFTTEALGRAGKLFHSVQLVNQAPQTLVLLSHQALAENGADIYKMFEAVKQQTLLVAECVEAPYPVPNLVSFLSELQAKLSIYQPEQTFKSNAALAPSMTLGFLAKSENENQESSLDQSKNGYTLKKSY